jgi:uncharacterized protein YlxP (DUF503 family)
MPAAGRSMLMVIGILQFELFIRGGESLKDKRRVVQSVKDRLHREHLVSVAEVAHHESLNHAVMAVAMVAVDGARVGEVLDNITAKLRSTPGADLGDCSRQLLRGSDIEDAPASLEEDPSLAREMLARMDNNEGLTP